MASIPLSSVATGTALSGSDTVLVVQGGVVKQVPGSTVSGQSVAFSAAVPFDGEKYTTTKKVVTGVDAFTVNSSGAIVGGTYRATLVADGVGGHVPSFTGFVEAPSNQGYDNRNGIENTVTFYYDGIYYYYQITQWVGQTPVVAPTTPTLVSAVIPNGAPATLVLTYSQALNTTAPAVSAFSVTNSAGSQTTTGTVVISGSTVTIPLSRSTLNGETVTATYVVPGTNPIKGLVGGLSAAAFTNTAVTNSVAGSGGATVVRLNPATLIGMTESGDGTNGYNYVSTGADNAAYAATNAGTSTLKLAGDGYYEVTLANWVTSQDSVDFALRTTNAVGAFSTCILGGYVSGSPNAYRFHTAGAGNANPNGATIAVATGDVWRLTVAGTTVTFGISKDSGSTFTTAYTWNSVTAGDKYLEIIGGDVGSTVNNLRGSGVS